MTKGLKDTVVVHLQCRHSLRNGRVYVEIAARVNCGSVDIAV